MTNDELPFFLDLQLFTGRPLVFASTIIDKSTKNYTSELVLGTFNPSEIALEVEDVLGHIKGNLTLETLKESCKQGYKMYLRSRPAATKSSYARAKEIANHSIGVHPIFVDKISQDETEMNLMIESIGTYRPSESIFEVGKKGSKTSEAILMKKRRRQFANTITTAKTQREAGILKEKILQQKVIDSRSNEIHEDVEIFSAKDKEKDYYLPYRPQDDHTEAGYAVHANQGASFNEQAHKASMDIVADDETDMKRQKTMTWDSKKHQFVKHQIGSDNKKRIRSENGTLIAATFKSNRFERWQKKTKITFGEYEQQSTPNFDITARKYRHNKIQPADINSKSFQRKIDQKEKELRKSGIRGRDLEQSKSEWIKSRVNVQQPIASGKSELRSGVDIARNRFMLDKRREKTGRHSVGKKKKK